MKNNFIKLTYLCILTSFIFLCLNSFAFAKEVNDSEAPKSGINSTILDDNLEDVYNKSDDFGPRLLKITNTVRGWAIAIIILSATATAVLFMISSFNTQLRQGAKASIFGLLIGIVILILSNNIGNLMYGILTKNGHSLINATADGTPREFGDIKKFGNKITDIHIKEDGSAGGSTDGDSTDDGSTDDGSTDGGSTDGAATGAGDNPGTGTGASANPSYGAVSINAPNPKYQYFIGKPVVMTANAIQYYYENNQLKYLSQEQASAALTMLKPLEGATREWNYIISEVSIIARTSITGSGSGPGVIPDYRAMSINVVTIQQAYDFDDVDKFTTTQLNTASDVITKEWFPNNKKPTVFDYRGRIAIKYHDTLEARKGVTLDWDPGVL